MPTYLRVQYTMRIPVASVNICRKNTFITIQQEVPVKVKNTVPVYYQIINRFQVISSSGGNIIAVTNPALLMSTTTPMKIEPLSPQARSSDEDNDN